MLTSPKLPSSTASTCAQCASNMSYSEVVFSFTRLAVGLEPVQGPHMEITEEIYRYRISRPAVQKRLHEEGFLGSSWIQDPEGREWKRRSRGLRC